MTALELNISILFTGTLQGILLVAFFYKKRNSLAGYPFLVFYLLVMILQMMMKLAGKIWLIHTLGPLYFFSYYLPFLYGPLIWMYCRQVIHKPVKRRTIFLHLLGFILLTAGTGIYDLFVGATLFSNGFFTVKGMLMLQLMSLAGYHYASWVLLRKSSSRNIDILYAQNRKWPLRFVISSFLLCSMIGMAICFMYYSFPNGQSIRWAFVLLPVFMYWTAYMAWCYPETFLAVHADVENGKRGSIPVAQFPPLAIKYSNSALKNGDLQKIIHELENRMRSTKPFLDANLTIDKLADSLGCRRHHLSQAVNELLQKSFSDYINSYRVEETKRLLTDPANSAYKITSLAFDAGFNSISTFNEVFKKFTGLTPSQFRSEQEKNRLQKQRV